MSIVTLSYSNYYPNLFELCDFILHSVMGFFYATVCPLFILAGTHTALIEMTIGALVHCAWEQWATIKTRVVRGIFLIVINGLAMMAAHSLLPQLAGKGWIGINGETKIIAQLIREFKKHKNTWT